jgi:hypothetical protein
MAKFYVESGNLQMVVHAKDARGAAIWAIHLAMRQMMPFLSDDSRKSTTVVREPFVLGELMKTSEQGFGRSDACMHDTFDVVTEWNRLIVAISELQSEKPLPADKNQEALPQQCATTPQRLEKPNANRSLVAAGTGV